MQTRISPSEPDPDYPRLHDIARHATHVTETLDTSLNAIRDLLCQHKVYHQQYPAQDKAAQKAVSQVSSGLGLVEHMLQNLKFRSISNSDRLKNEINLVGAGDYISRRIYTESITGFQHGRAI
jgi:hypothetical protein